MENEIDNKMETGILLDYGLGFQPCPSRVVCHAQFAVHAGIALVDSALSSASDGQRRHDLEPLGMNF